MNTSEATILRLAPGVRYEPCSDFHAGAIDDGLCAGCGWACDDHGLVPEAA